MGRNVVTKWDSFSAKKIVTKWDYGCYKVGQVLQSEKDVATKWDRCNKVERLLQSGHPLFSILWFISCKLAQAVHVEYKLS